MHLRLLMLAGLCAASAGAVERPPSDRFVEAALATEDSSPLVAALLGRARAILLADPSSPPDVTTRVVRRELQVLLLADLDERVLAVFHALPTSLRRSVLEPCAPRGLASNAPTFFLATDRDGIGAPVEGTRLVILTPEEVTLAARKFGTFSLPRVSVLMTDATGDRRYIEWRKSMSGGAFVATKSGTTWRLTRIGDWVS